MEEQNALEEKQRRVEHEMRRLVAVRQLKCLNSVVEQIAAGDSLAEIATYIHKKKEMSGFEHKSVVECLMIFIQHNRDKFPHRVPNLTKKRIKRTIQTDDTYIDPLDTYQFLEAIQMERLMMAFQKELESGELYQITDNQIKLMNNILKNHAAVETDRTIRYVRRNPEEKAASDLPERLRAVRERITEEHGERVSNVLTDPESRRRLLNVIEMVKGKAQSSKAKKILQNKLDRLKAADLYLSGEFTLPNEKKKEDKEDVIDV